MAENYFYSTHSAQEMEDVFDGAVLSNKGQTLSTSQKAQARANIGAGSENTGFQILGYFLTLEEMKESLQVPPRAGDAYGIAVFRLTTDAAPEAGIKYYTRSGSGTTQDPYVYTLFEGSSFDVGVDYYVIAYYDTYIFDGTSQDWLDIGPVNEGEFIDDSEVSPILTWSSQKINAELAARDTEIENAQDAADNAQSTADNAVSYAEAQTLTTAQKKQARDNIGADWTLMWQNASPTSAFAAQTVSISLSDYDDVLIVYRRTTDASETIEFFDNMERVGGTFGKTQNVRFMYGATGTNTYYGLAWRDAEIGNSGVTFEDANRMDWDRSNKQWNGSSDNAVLLPVAIYAR